MSKEAKVGLLLGLAFIVGIAVVLRGVNENGQDLKDESLTISQVDTSVGTAAQSEPENFSVVVSRFAPGPVEAMEIAAPGEPASPRGSEAVVLAGEREVPVGYAIPLRPEQTQPPSAQHAPRYVQDLPGSPRPRGSIAAVARALDNISARLQTPSATIVSPPPAIRYTVREGDDLSKVALRVYGPVEGRRWVNVERIYKANRSRLASMDEIRPGQKLQIPSLPSGTTGSSAAVGTENHEPQSAQRPAEATTYVVKDGDSLWLIAEKQLGNGGRFAEIARLNSKLLGDEDQITPGMQLCLPKN